jgi:hypothetical protein
LLRQSAPYHFTDLVYQNGHRDLHAFRPSLARIPPIYVQVIIRRHIIFHS